LEKDNFLCFKKIQITFSLVTTVYRPFLKFLQAQAIFGVPKAHDLPPAPSLNPPAVHDKCQPGEKPWKKNYIQKNRFLYNIICVNLNDFYFDGVCWNFGFWDFMQAVEIQTSDISLWNPTFWFETYFSRVIRNIHLRLNAINWHFVAFKTNRYPYYELFLCCLKNWPHFELMLTKNKQSSSTKKKYERAEKLKQVAAAWR